MPKKSCRKHLNIFLFYTIVGLTGIILLPTLGIIAPTFIFCGIITPILGLVELVGYIFNIDIPLIIFKIGQFSPNPILEFILSIFIGIILYFLGTYTWKLLIKYINVVRDIKKKL